MPERQEGPRRRFVAGRAGFRCEYCLTPSGLSPSPYSAEHILPRSKGGADLPDNVALSCQGCNGHKAAKTTAIDPARGKSVSLFNPRRDKWEDHFSWTADGTKIVGKTAPGRATVVALHLNRSGLQNLRRLMVIANIHPAER